MRISTFADLPRSRNKIITLVSPNGIAPDTLPAFVRASLATKSIGSQDAWRDYEDAASLKKAPCFGADNGLALTYETASSYTDWLADQTALSRNPTLFFLNDLTLSGLTQPEPNAVSHDYLWLKYAIRASRHPATMPKQLILVTPLCSKRDIKQHLLLSRLTSLFASTSSIFSEHRSPISLRLLIPEFPPKSIKQAIIHQIDPARSFAHTHSLWSDLFANSLADLIASPNPENTSWPIAAPEISSLKQQKPAFPDEIAIAQRNIMETVFDLHTEI